MTPHQFVGGFEGNISGCMWHGQPLGCQFVVPRRNPKLHMQSGAGFQGTDTVHNDTGFVGCVMAYRRLLVVRPLEVLSNGSFKTQP